MPSGKHCSSTSNTSDKELEVFNAAAELQQLNLNTEKNSNAYVAWCLPSRSPFNGYDVQIVKIPTEDLKLLDNITSISNFKKITKQNKLINECYALNNRYNCKRKRLDSNTPEGGPLQPVLFGQLQASRPQDPNTQIKP